MLAHSDRDRRQLGHLTPRRLGDMLGRKQPPVPALMPVLPAPLPARPLPTRAWRSRERILRRRQRRVPRTPIQTTLELSNPSLEPLVRLHQTPIRIHQLAEPQQQRDSRFAITIQDRLRLDPLHTKPFATRTQLPAPPERLPESRA